MEYFDGIIDCLAFWVFPEFYTNELTNVYILAYNKQAMQFRELIPASAYVRKTVHRAPMN
mgnify:CR=1 FL=1